MYYLSLEIPNLHPIVIRDMRCVKGVMFYRIRTGRYSTNNNNNFFKIIFPTKSVSL